MKNPRGRPASGRADVELVGHAVNVVGGVRNLASRLGVSPSLVSRWRGGTPVSARLLAEIGLVLAQSLSEIGLVLMGHLAEQRRHEGDA